ncbi:FecR domain-containing protein [Pseudoalteromonas luteoviolacea]|uniref:FecR family protein n=1 Tax=Pseudoalteromonas luteoviolacea TaxID=43657 RepID=UPI001F241B63|nr:FecR domain-containing protein [Pseudoalteromonas luteoviolacea]MCF6439181.1 FecR domain-containing protein [Pseudoalteromonas luteoviolacea]
MTKPNDVFGTIDTDLNTTSSKQLIEQQATNWLLIQDELDLDQKVQFEQWLIIDPEHERIYRCLEEALSLVEQVPVAQSLDPEMLVAQLKNSSKVTISTDKSAANNRVYRWFAVAASVMLISMLGWFGLEQQKVSPVIAQQIYQTETAQVETHSLADGSVVTLGPDSKLLVSMSNQARSLKLLSGEGYFDVVSDKARPFIVSSGQVAITVIGTEFNVRFNPSSIQVAVAQGKVEVELQDWHAKLQAGEVIIADNSRGLSEVTSIDPTLIDDWLQGQLIYQDAPLGHIVAQLNRYYAGQIIVVGEDVEQLRVTASFSTQDIPSVIQDLAAMLSLEYTQSGDTWLLTKPAMIKTN